MNIILASQSPRRLRLLQAAGYKVEVRPSDIDESPLAGESAQAMTVRLCQAKAKACYMADSLVPVIAADTLVAIGDEALGQPADLAEAKTMIQKLSGQQHEVHTAVCVMMGNHSESIMVTTKVAFREVADVEIDIYLEHNDILDKAGAYAIQGGASGFIIGIEGSLDNVIGLPVQPTLSLMQRVASRFEAEQGV